VTAAFDVITGAATVVTISNKIPLQAKAILMTNTEQHPFQPGVKVALVRRVGNSVSYATVEVAKVHKTGRFLLVGGDTQFSPSKPSHEGDIWTAHSTGHLSNRSFSFIQLETEDLKAAAAKTRLENRWRKAVADLGQLNNKTVDLATNADCEAIEGVIKRLTERLDTP